MKKSLLAATLCAAFIAPVAATGIIHVEGPDPEFRMEIDLAGMLAQADDARAAAAEAAARAKAEAARARTEGARARAEGERIRIDTEEWARDFAENMQNSMTFMFADRAGRGRVVKGQPYSADVVTETNRTLADGNVISHRNVNHVYRDAEGRTRQETFRNDKLRSVYISDPVAGMAYTVLPGSKIAVAIPRIDLAHEMHHVRPPRPPRPPRDAEGKGKTSTEIVNSDGQRRVIVRTVDDNGMPGVREEVRVQVVRVGDDANISIAPTPPTPPTPPSAPGVAPVPPVPPLIAGVHTMRFEDMGHLGKGETKSLGTKDFDGVKAEGKTTTWTIPAGKIGNKNPITVVSESWYAPDLQVTVYSRYNDPRTGESVYRLASIKRGEPQADLFKVPEGYTIKGRGRDREKDKAEKK